MNETNERTNSSNALERAPSALSTDCPIEACLEFSVVDYWGNPVTSPSKFELDGKPVQPDTPIFNLASRDHILKAVDGEELRKQILNFPYQPIKPNPFPAKLLADKKEYKFIPADKDNIWRGIPLTTSPNEKCCKYVIEVDQGIDYYILMVFLDNHSGNFHGTGHAGVIIINGETQKGLYSHFGPYKKLYSFEPDYENLDSDPYVVIDEVGDVINYYINENILLTKYGMLDEIQLADQFSIINFEYGSNIISSKSCSLRNYLFGPEHENIYSKKLKINGVATNIDIPMINQLNLSMPPGFKINGNIAWALYCLPKGSYKRMSTYIQNKTNEMKLLQDKHKNGYKPMDFNCITYSLEILDNAFSINNSPREDDSVNWPNYVIRKYMSNSHDCGIFDNRLCLGIEDAIHFNKQERKKSIRHHEQLTLSILNGIVGITLIGKI